MSLKSKDIELIVLILQILIKYGYPALMNFIAALNKDEFTLEDIRGFKIDDDEPFIP